MSNSMNIIKEYLVSLGFSVDNTSYAKMQQALKDMSASVERHTSGMALNYVKAGGLITSALLAINAATVGLIDRVAQADLGYQKFALRMYMARDTAKQLKITTDALGESLEDIAWIPELRERYFKLMGEAKGMETPADAEKQLRYIRDIRFEFTRLKVEATYGLQWIGYNLIKNLAGPLGDTQNTFKKLNDWIQEKMPQWTKTVADWLTMFLQLGGDVVRVFKELFGGLKQLWDILPPLGKEIAIIGGIIGLYFASGPVGRAVIVISTLILLLDDFYAYIDGRKSSKNLAPIWHTLLMASDSLVRSLRQVIESVLVVQELYDKLSGRSKMTWGDIWTDAKNILNQPGIGDIETNRIIQGQKNQGIENSQGKYSNLISKYFPVSAQSTAKKVMMAESSGNPSATNLNRNGTIDTGLFQINTVNLASLQKAGIIQSAADLNNPEKNIAAAAYLQNQSGWSPWKSSESKWGGKGDTTITVGDIEVNVANSNATPYDIARATQKAVEVAMGKQVARNLQDFGGVY